MKHITACSSSSGTVFGGFGGISSSIALFGLDEDGNVHQFDFGSTGSFIEEKRKPRWIKLPSPGENE